MKADVPAKARCGATERYRQRRNLAIVRDELDEFLARVRRGPERDLPEPENYVTPTRIHLAADGTKYLRDTPVKVWQADNMKFAQTIKGRS